MNDHLRRAAGLSDFGNIPTTPERITTLTIPSQEVEILRMLQKQPMLSEHPVEEASLPCIEETSLSSLCTDNRSPCPVCLQKIPLLTNEPINAVTNCKHVFCYECALRLIFIIKREKESKEEPVRCPSCRQELTKVILTKESLETVAAVNQFILRAKVRRYLDIVWYDSDDLFDAIKNVITFPCNGCNFDFHKQLGEFKKNASTFKEISRHLSNKHNSYICELCFYNIEQFPIEIVVYDDRTSLRRHLRHGSKVGDSFVKHQLCTLCHVEDSLELKSMFANYYFNTEALIVHCKKEHLSCYFCCSNTTTFFLDNQTLDRHICERHIVCPVCQKDGVIYGFGTIFELKDHVERQHSMEKIDYKGLAKLNIAQPIDAAANVNIVDNIFRGRHHVQQQTNPPSFGTNTCNSEQYIVNFPSMGPSIPVELPKEKDDKNDHFSKAPNYSKQLVGNNTEVVNEKDFPGLNEILPKEFSVIKNPRIWDNKPKSVSQQMMQQKPVLGSNTCWNTQNSSKKLISGPSWKPIAPVNPAITIINAPRTAAPVGAGTRILADKMNNLNLNEDNFPCLVSGESGGGGIGGSFSSGIQKTKKKFDRKAKL